MEKRLFEVIGDYLVDKCGYKMDEMCIGFVTNRANRITLQQLDYVMYLNENDNVSLNYAEWGLFATFEDLDKSLIVANDLYQRIVNHPDFDDNLIISEVKLPEKGQTDDGICYVVKIMIKEKEK